MVQVLGFRVQGGLGLRVQLDLGFRLHGLRVLRFRVQECHGSGFKV